MDYQPFGEQIPGSSGTTHKFEGKERDAETNNDDFGARYYSSSVGRWLSADWSAIPAPVPYANLTNPQTLNLYAMVSDNPESFADLDGHAAMNSAAPITPSDDPICANVDSPKGACNAEGAGEFIRAVTTDANNGQDDPATDQSADDAAAKQSTATAVTAPTADQAIENTSQDVVNSVAKPLIDSADEKAGSAVIDFLTSGLAKGLGVVVAAVGDMTIFAHSAGAGETEMLHEARSRGIPDLQNAKHRKGARKSTWPKHSKSHSSRNPDKLRRRADWQTKKGAGGGRSPGSWRDKEDQ